MTTYLKRLNFLRYPLLTMTDLFQRHGAQPTRRRRRKSQPVVAQQQQLGLLLRLPSRRLRFAVLAGLHSRWDVLLR